jgi:ribosomal protein S17E
MMLFCYTFDLNKGIALIFYYYAHTGHRGDLDGVRRAVALLPYLESQGIVTKLLVNDFRATLVAKEYGIEGAVSIESINDIDLVVDIGDSLFIDSNEELPKHFENFCRDYKKVFRLARDCDDKVQSQEELLFPWDENMQAIFIDDITIKEHKKRERVIFFYGDSDSKKELLNIASRFKNHNIELLLGEYFYLGYEDELKNYFALVHEPEQYNELIASSKDIITSSLQCALEAKSAGAHVAYVPKKSLEVCIKELLNRYQIAFFENYDFDINKFLLQSISKKITKTSLRNHKIDFYIKNKINS